MKDKTKMILLQLVADGIIVANTTYQMFFTSDPASFGKLNTMISGGIAGAYLMYRLKVQKCWRDNNE